MEELGRVYNNGEMIFSKGQVGDNMYIIQTGEVRIAIDGQTLTVLKSGDIFGEMALFDKMPRSADAIAVGGARVLSVNKAKLFKTINRDPTLVFKILRSMAERVRRLSDEVTMLRNEKDT